MGIIISSAVLPVILTLCWKQQNVIAAVASPILGTGLAIMSWLVCTKSLFTNLTIDTTFKDYPMLTGNVVALCSPAIFVPILTYLFKPQNFDWEILKTISRVDETEEITENLETIEGVIINDTEKNLYNSSSADEAKDVNINVKNEEKLQAVTTIMSSIRQEPNLRDVNQELEEEELKLAKGLKVAYFLCIFFALAFLIVWPMPMYGSRYIFSKKFFTGWVVVMIIWIFISAFCVCVYPCLLYTSRCV